MYLCLKPYRVVPGLGKGYGVLPPRRLSEEGALPYLRGWLPSGLPYRRVPLQKCREVPLDVAGRDTGHLVPDQLHRQGEIGLTPRTKRVLELAVDEVRRMNQTYVGTHDLLIGLLQEGEGVCAGVLESLGVNVDKARASTHHILSQGASSRASGLPGANTSPYRLDRLRGEMTSQFPDPHVEVLYVGAPDYLAAGKSVEAEITMVAFSPEKHVEVLFDGSTTKIWRDAYALRFAGKRMPVEGLAVILDRDERDPDLAHQAYPVTEMTQAGWGLVDILGRSRWMPPKSPLSVGDRVVEVPLDGQTGPFLHLALQGYLLQKGPQSYIDELASTEVNLWDVKKEGDPS